MPFDLARYFDTTDAGKCWRYVGPVCRTAQGSHKSDGALRTRAAPVFQHPGNRIQRHRPDYLAPSPVFYESRYRSIWKVAMHLFRPELFDAPAPEPTWRYKAKTAVTSASRRYGPDRLPQLALWHVAPGVLCGHRPSCDRENWPIPCGNPFHGEVLRPGTAPRARKRYHTNAPYYEVFRNDDGSLITSTNPPSFNDEYTLEDFQEGILSLQDAYPNPIPDETAAFLRDYEEYPSFLPELLQLPNNQLNPLYLSHLQKLLP